MRTYTTRKKSHSMPRLGEEEAANVNRYTMAQS